MSANELDSNLLDAIIAWANANLKETVEEQSYTGFNPVTVRRKMLDEGMEVDKVLMVLTFCMYRGTNVSKAIKRMSEDGKKKLTAALAYLKIDLNKNEKPDSRTMTVSRLSACFPEICSMIMGKFGKAENPDCKLDIHLQFPQARSIIINPSIVKDWEDWSIEFTEKIKGNVDSQKKFWKIQEDSKMFTNEQRAKYETKDWWVKKQPERISSLSDQQQEITRAENTVSFFNPQQDAARIKNFNLPKGVRVAPPDVSQFALKSLKLSNKTKKMLSVVYEKEGDLRIDGRSNKGDEYLKLLYHDGTEYTFKNENGEVFRKVCEAKSGTWHDIVSTKHA